MAACEMAGGVCGGGCWVHGNAGIGAREQLIVVCMGFLKECVSPNKWIKGCACVFE